MTTPDGANSVCVVAILKEEDPFVEEWVAYHRLLGVDHFYLYDDDPRQPLADLVASYENPPDLVIECLTRRLKEPRAMTKTLTRPAAIASMDGPHFCRLKKGRKRIDANKRHMEEVYPGKTGVARINHYQCRSFLNWMQRVERGEVRAVAEDPENTWRFDREDLLAQVCDKHSGREERARRYFHAAARRECQSLYE